MDKAIERYRRRRQARLDAKNGIEKERNSVDEYKKRRDARLSSRMDAGQGWVFGALKAKGVDISEMDLGEAYEAWNELNEGKGKGSKKEESAGGKKNAKKEESSEEKGKKSESKAESKKPVIKRSAHDKKGKEADGSGYTGEPGEVKTGKNGNLKPKSETSKRIDVSDALAETQAYKDTGGAKGIEKNSLSDFIDENGNLTPERQKVHDEIVQRVFADKVPHEGQATMIMSGGGPASGKSFISKGAEEQFGKETVVVIDPDKIKAMLPGYADMAVAGDKAAGFYHEESSALAKRVYQYCLDNNINAVYDGTGDGSIGSVKKKIQAARDAGYKARGEYVTVNTDEALRRNEKRYQDGIEAYKKGETDIPPRKPPEKMVRDTHRKVADIQLDAAPLFDEFVLTDNNGPEGSERPVIATCKRNGEIEVAKGMESLMQDALNKGSRVARVKNGKIVFVKGKMKRL